MIFCQNIYLATYLSQPSRPSDTKPVPPLPDKTLPPKRAPPLPAAPSLPTSISSPPSASNEALQRSVDEMRSELTQLGMEGRMQRKKLRESHLRQLYQQERFLVGLREQMAADVLDCRGCMEKRCPDCGEIFFKK